MKFIDQLKKKFIKNEKKKEKNEKEKIKDIPKEILDKLPPGVKIKRIEIGPKQIIKFLIYLVLSYFILLTLFDLLVPQSLSQVSLSQVISEVKKENVEKIMVSSDQIIATLKGGEKILVSSKENTSSLSEVLQREGIELSGINLEVNNREGWKIFGEIFTLLLTVGLPLFFILWLFRKQSGAGGAGGVFGFGKATAKLFIKGKQSLTFKDVAGVEEAKNDLVEVVDFLKHPEKYQKMGARAPKGVLLVGPSGVGKTLLAKAVAGEAGVPFYSMAVS